MPDDGRFLGSSPTAPITAPPKPPARLPSAGRLFRPALGAALVVAALVFLQDRFLTMEARHAVLDGAPLTLRSPVEGAVDTLVALPPGSVVEAGTPLAVVRNELLDASRIGDLDRLRRIAEAEASGLSRRLEHARAELLQAGANAAAYAAARAEMIEARLREAHSAHEAALARRAEAAVALRRVESLAASGVQSLATLDAARRAAQVAEADLRAAADRRDVVAAEQAAIAAGVLASDTSHDRSASQLSEERLRLLAEELAAARHEATTRAVALGAQLAEETTRHARLQEATLAAPGRARVVRRLAQPGEHVAAGQGVLLLSDCAQPEVVALVEPRVFRQLIQGRPALFHVAGEDTPREGRIAALRAEPAGADGAGGRLEVVVALQPGDDTACDSGRLGRLSFP
jgi:multidrug resistance efflux pump